MGFGSGGTGDVKADTETILVTLGTPAVDISADIAAVDTVVDAIKLQTDKILGVLFTKRFYSNPQASATLDTTGTTDVALPSVVIPAAGYNSIPTGATIRAAFAMLMYGSRRDTSGLDNAINGDQYIQVKESVAGSYINAILIADNTMNIDVSEATVMGGNVLFGNIDVVSQISAVNKTYQFQWTDCKVDGNNLILDDMRMVLELWYTI